MQADLIEELMERVRQKEEQLKCKEQSLKEKEMEYFALEVGGWPTVRWENRCPDYVFIF